VRVAVHGVSPGRHPKTFTRGDICGAANCSLLDHLVRAGQQRVGHRQSERLGGLQVDDQLVLGRRLHRKVGRLLALQDAVDVLGRRAELAWEVGPGTTSGLRW
jgi:hypothetical protein